MSVLGMEREHGEMAELEAATERAACAVVIPHYNDAERLRLCLARLLACSAPADLVETAEIVVVDNNSSVDLSEIRATFPTVRFVTETQQGAAAARNRGVRETSAELLFFLDADCIPAPDWLAAARAAVAKSDVVGGAVEMFDERPPPRSGAEAFDTIFGFDQRYSIERQGFSVTANLLTSRSVFEDVGDFADDVSEDVDWCRRAGAKGYRLVYDDAVRVDHPTRRDWPALKKKWRRLVQQEFALRGSAPAARVRWLARAALVLFSPLGHAPKIVVSPRLSSALERRRGLATLFRVRLQRAYWMLRQVIGLPI